MSVQATAWAWSIRDLPPHLKITLLAIADACNAEGYGYPGQERLAHQVQCSDRQIRSNVAALVKRGLIAVIHRPGDGSGRRRPSCARRRCRRRDPAARRTLCRHHQRRKSCGCRRHRP